jgi:hypothetical protein
MTRLSFKCEEITQTCDPLSFVTLTPSSLTTDQTKNEIYILWGYHLSFNFRKHNPTIAGSLLGLDPEDRSSEIKAD